MNIDREITRDIQAAARLLTGKSRQLGSRLVDNHGNDFFGTLEDTSNGVILEVEELTGETYGKWRWYLSSLLEHPNNDKISLDHGQGWYVTGMRKLLKEAQRSTKVMVAFDKRRMAADDLGKIRELLPAMEEKQRELKERQERELQESNRLYYEATKVVGEKTTEIIEEAMIVAKSFFEKNGCGVRRSSASGSLMEVFLGSKDGVDRVQSKVSIHLTLTSELDRAKWMLRNEDIGETMEGRLDDRATVKGFLGRIKKAWDSGFWEEGE